MMKNYRIELTKDSKDLPEEVYCKFFDICVNGFEITVKDDETPMAWDADFRIIDGKFVIEGHVGPCGFGEVLIKIPVDKVNECYQIFLYMDEKFFPEIKELLNFYNYEIKLD